MIRRFWRSLSGPLRGALILTGWLFSASTGTAWQELSGWHSTPEKMLANLGLCALFALPLTGIGTLNLKRMSRSLEEDD